MPVSMPQTAIAAAQEQPALVTIPNVPLVSTGTYELGVNAFGGDTTTFTMEDLRSAVAAQDDPHLPAPRLKIGHTSDWGDGEPAFGRVTNMRLDGNQQTIYADLENVPAWLAEVMPAAYPARSIEAMFGVETNAHTTHRFVITALALLGVVAPGVSSLEDLASMYGAEKPEEVEVEVAATGRQVQASVGGESMPTTVAASVDIEQVRRDYYDTLGNDQTWWWITAIRVDPMDLIIEDESDGSMYRVPYSIQGEEVTFADPIPVDIVYVDTEGEKATAARVAAGAGRMVCTYASRSESRPETQPQEGAVDGTEFRNLLGLPEDATDVEVREAAQRMRAETPPSQQPPGESEGDPAEQGPETGTPSPTEDPSNPTDPSPQEPDPAEQPGQPQEQPAGVGASGLVQMDAATAEQLRRDAAAGAEARRQQVRSHRQSVISAAQGQGRFPASRREHWERQYESDPEGTEHLLTASVEDGGLAPGLVPVEERGASASADPEHGGGDAYPAEWLPEVQARQDAQEQRVIDTRKVVS